MFLHSPASPGGDGAARRREGKYERKGSHGTVVGRWQFIARPLRIEKTDADDVSTRWQDRLPRLYGRVRVHALRPPDLRSGAASFTHVQGRRGRNLGEDREGTSPADDGDHAAILINGAP